MRCLIRYFIFAYASIVCRSFLDLSKKVINTFSYCFNEANSLVRFKAQINAYTKCDMSWLFTTIQDQSYKLIEFPFKNKEIIINVVSMPFSLDGTSRLYDYYVCENVLYVSKVGIGGYKFSGLKQGLKEVLYGKT